MEVIDETGVAPAERPVIDLVEAVLGAEGTSGFVTVAFVAEQTIAELNRRYRGVAEPTDVLSFRYADDGASWPTGPARELPERQRTPVTELPPDLGEVIICLELVRRYAGADGVKPGRQTAWTLVHGVLHLLGYDHEQDQGDMRRRERALLTEFEGAVDSLDLGTGY